MSRNSKVILHQTGRQVFSRGAAEIASDKDFALDDMRALGLGFAAMDAELVGPAATTGYIPAAMLQTWIQGTVRVITAPIDIDYVAGITIVGNWHDNEIAIRTEEALGMPALYGDSTNVPLADVNPGYELRDVVRFEQGFNLGALEDRRMKSAGFEVETSKREAVARSLDNVRNTIGWVGLAGSKTYGLLNDPNLTPIRALGTWTAWLNATFDQLCAQFTTMREAIETQMGTALRDDAEFLLLLPSGYRGIFNKYNTAGNLSFREWLSTNYPNLRVEYAASLKAASAGEDVGYLIAENVSQLDASDVGSATIIQAVPSRYEVIGSERHAKGYLETASNASAGVIVLRPWAVTRAEVSGTTATP